QDRRDALAGFIENQPLLIRREVDRIRKGRAIGLLSHVLLPLRKRVRPAVAGRTALNPAAYACSSYARQRLPNLHRGDAILQFLRGELDRVDVLAGGVLDLLLLLSRELDADARLFLCH